MEGIRLSRGIWHIHFSGVYSEASLLYTRNEEESTKMYVHKALNCGQWSQGKDENGQN